MRPLCDVTIFNYNSTTNKDWCTYPALNGKIHELLDMITSDMSNEILSEVRGVLKKRIALLVPQVWVKKNEDDVYNSFEIEDGLLSKKYYIYLYTVNYISAKI